MDYYIKGYKARQRARQYKEDKEILKQYLQIIPLSILLTAVFWVLAVGILSI
jgi:hypothetical protein